MQKKETMRMCLYTVVMYISKMSFHKAKFFSGYKPPSLIWAMFQYNSQQKHEIKTRNVKHYELKHCSEISL